MSRATPLILATAIFMENMDSTVIATSLAAIAADIGTDPISLKLALTAYLVALAIFIPISSWMADRFGARRVFRLAMLVFMIGSIACAFSGSLAQFVGARFIQGMGGAMMGPVARLVLVRMTPRHQLVDAMAWLTIPGLIGPIVGPPFGGFLTTYFSWHWIFIINIPIGLLGMALVGLALPSETRNKPRSIDGKGFVLAGLAFALFAFGCSVVSLPALPPVYGVVAASLGIGLGYFYIRHALSTEYPLLDLRLLRLPIFRVSVVAGSFFRLGQGAVPFLFPLMLQLGFGLSPFESGMVTFVAAIGALAAKFVANRIFKRWGFKYPLLIASLVSTLGILVMGFYVPGTPIPLMLGILVFTGFWQSTFWTGSNAFVFADVDDKDAGQANVISQVWGQLMFAMGVAVGGGTLELAHRLRGGGELALADFHIAFFVVSAISAVAVVMFLRIPRNAGHQLMSGPHMH
ncbi:EmrB/QacA subfamily drug resistance transporter [Devosia subaequoris]|uniref:EmrB/QacA subfamily drug resistance transporter n=1 Tax=Devosia subaequoris TaxID=395930 RepID=A0A7W6NAH0_9HYPH|nr:MFS transporter [Devosia subaequoris]MBB4050908.1 EmrB/QacA subfamily drug resistance transporter [Devosia subaequoris]MCP1208417.1 MFS transporter [Devosia subaequoris]